MAYLTVLYNVYDMVNAASTSGRIFDSNTSYYCKQIAYKDWQF